MRNKCLVTISLLFFTLRIGAGFVGRFLLQELLHHLLHEHLLHQVGHEVAVLILGSLEKFQLNFTCTLEATKGSFEATKDRFSASRSIAKTELKNNDHMPSMTTILGSHFHFLYRKATSEQRPPVNNGHNLGVSRVVVVHRFDYIQFFGAWDRL